MVAPSHPLTFDADLLPILVKGGWVDPNASYGEAAEEYKAIMESLSDAASAKGYDVSAEQIAQVLQGRVDIPPDPRFPGRAQTVLRDVQDLRRKLVNLIERGRTAGPNPLDLQDLWRLLEKHKDALHLAHGLTASPWPLLTGPVTIGLIGGLTAAQMAALSQAKEIEGLRFAALGAGEGGFVAAGPLLIIAALLAGGYFVYWYANRPDTAPVQATLKGDPTARPQQPSAATFKIAKTHVTRYIFNKPSQELEFSGLQSSLTLVTNEPDFDSHTTGTITVPNQVVDAQTIKIIVDVKAEFSLQKTTEVITIGLNALGQPKWDGLPKPGGSWLSPGSYSLTVSHTNETSFGQNDFVRKWTESGVTYRSFWVDINSGVSPQRHTSARMTFIYQAEK